MKPIYREHAIDTLNQIQTCVTDAWKRLDVAIDIDWQASNHFMVPQILDHLAAIQDALEALELDIDDAKDLAQDGERPNQASFSRSERAQPNLKW